MTPTFNLLVLRPSYLHFQSRKVPFDEVAYTDFRVPRQALQEVDAILYIDGIRTKFLKDKYDKSGKHPCPYRPSSFSERTADVRVVGDSLFCTFPADEKMEIEAGLLISPQWTKEDDGRTHPEDDVLGATVSRQNEAGEWLKFHDIGFFIPDYDEVPTDAHLRDDPLRDRRIAHSEGWDLFDIDTTEIQRDDEAAVFPDDQAAIDFVRGAGAPYHQKAIAIHEAPAAEAFLHRAGPPVRAYLADSDRWERLAIKAKRDVTLDHQIGKWAWYDRETREDRTTWHSGFTTRIEALADAIGPLLSTRTNQP